MLQFIQKFSLFSVNSPVYLTQRSAGTRYLLKRLGFPEKPKKPKPSFLMFVDEVGQEIAQKQKDIKRKELLQIASVKWKALTPDQKQVYNEQFQKSAEKYKKELSKYEKSLTESQKLEMEEAKKDFKMIRDLQMKRLMKNKKIEELNKPKRPLAPFFRYLATLGKKGEPVTVTAKRSGQMWHSLPTAVKQKYFDEYENELSNYKKELLEWEEKMIRNGHHDVVRMKTLQKEYKRVGE